MDAVKKRKIKKFIQKNKKILIGGGIFAIIGLIGLLLGFEITSGWHAIRNWLSSPYAATFFICAVIGALIIGMLIVVLLNLRRGDN